MKPADIVERFVAPALRLCADPPPRLLPVLPSTAQAALAWAVATATGRLVLLVCDGLKSLEELHRDLMTLAPFGDAVDAHLFYFPEWESAPSAPEAEEDQEIAGHRLRVSALFNHPPQGPVVIAACVQSVMQHTIAPEQLAQHTLPLRIGTVADPGDIARDLHEAGYEFAAEVDRMGTAARRGGLLDLWPPTELLPLRVEFFGDEVESIRHFDPATQRSRGLLEEAPLAPAGEWPLLRRGTAGGSIAQFLPHDAVVFWIDADSVAEHADSSAAAARESGYAEMTETWSALTEALNARRGITQVLTRTADDDAGCSAFPAVLPAESCTPARTDAADPDITAELRRRKCAERAERAAAGEDVVVFFDTEGTREHLQALFPSESARQIHFLIGPLSSGFVCEPLGLALLTESDLLGRRKTLSQRYDPWARRRHPHLQGVRIADLDHIEPGDLVVHDDHGIGRYLGLCEIAFNDRRQEVLTIEYADDAKLHVPATQAHLLSRYMGTGNRHASLHKLGGKRWSKDKSDAQLAVLDMAASLLETQAERSLMRGHAFPPDTAWQHDFEAAFPYRETRDQVRVIHETKHDLEQTRPMDRLICGDAGYGKTEVAMRAAFKVVMSGRQVAMLVPTTVLAQQHYDTFRDRMSGYPIRTEVMSRFRTRGQLNRIAADLAAGTVDIVIGTHALLQPGIRFKDLGLVVIDEEQRFGVEQKDRLKQLRRMVDVLTLTATPIPRTLYMSMTGTRDMSLLQTPPRERMAIETIVTRNTDEVIRRAILRELNRDGQVFYLYNRVLTIDRMRRRLDLIVPEARVAVAHGQMAAGELALVMRGFTSGEFDVLLCTTIIESGVDIPRANTILIDRADRFGIADLYQLRGRVGRSSHKAYAYLLLPPSGIVDSDARRRIAAVRRYSSLSAGFNLALRDLEIRGAGNVLGAQQSGHIAAVGFGLYCQLLQQSISKLKGEKPQRLVDVEMRLDFIELAPEGNPERAAAIPLDYIGDEPLRIGAYRQIASASTSERIEAIREDLRDRFGPLPPPAARLLRIAAVRVEAARHDIRLVEVREHKVRLFRGKDYLMQGTHFPRLTPASADATLDELLGIVAAVDQWSR